MSPGPEFSGSTLYLRGRVSTSLIASMLTSLGSTAKSDVTYMMMDFLSGNWTATSETGEAKQQWGEMDQDMIEHERQDGERRDEEGGKNA